MFVAAFRIWLWLRLQFYSKFLTKKHFIDPNLTKPYLTILAAKDVYLITKDIYLADKEKKQYVCIFGVFFVCFLMICTMYDIH